MKTINKKIFIGVFSLFVFLIQAQVKVNSAEYFWDTDPGEGNATALPASDGNFDNAIEDILQNNIAIPASAGFHVLNVRVKDSQGVWGPVFKNIVHTGTVPATGAINLTNAEYFWDTDPGEGNGTALTAADGNFDSTIENILQNNIPIAQPMGFHIFNVRVKDNQGVWGPAFKNVVYIETSLLGTNEVKLTKNIVCYPNPADDIINFNITGKMNIYSSEGRLVISKDNVDGSKGVNVSSLIKGNYILTIDNKDGRFSSKFIKK
ncbi:Por secretion system C-terminal sorting domain-containing protein [Chryseobacterium arachidis]|uniref:Por secretion system C-terminal sorting domain-containing protein n=1 Tax=Chryseobacterium arachidis TaxID=1416778 RepID=A0A1M5ADX5_9FLAO|nr:T9SS type A sorting domain-containing protein [Chryseobacterium arachidis]SHF28500.1 Por secretion system C-terminal sorting domain-containing protein [Chryseobacterium arachidis]